jgi:uncharacterized membrane-anchored protein
MKGASKVPRITLHFWALKLLTTALGEATSDYLVHTVNPYLAVIGGFVVFLAAMALQFAVDRYRRWVYWFAVAMVAVFGTMAADVLHIQFGVPYAVSTCLFAAALTVVFVAWQRSEGTLSIHSIHTRSRETFYWAAVLATFAMGTAAGDLAAYTLKLGFLSAGLVFATVFALPALAYALLDANPILTFWFAYVVTRPLGASFADWGGKPRHAGGLGYGDGPVAAVLLAAMLAIIISLGHSGADEPEHEPAGSDLEPATATDY